MAQSNVTDFWAVIEAARAKRGSDGAEFAERVGESLATLETPDLINASIKFADALRAANRWDLWAAAYIMNGGCSDDGFVYWRCWLIAQGKENFDAALADPQALAGMKLKYGEEGEYELEDLLMAFDGAFENAEVSEEDRPIITDSGDTQGTELSLEDEDEMQSRFPKLCKKFGDN